MIPFSLLENPLSRVFVVTRKREKLRDYVVSPRFPLLRFVAWPPAGSRGGWQPATAGSAAEFLFHRYKRTKDGKTRQDILPKCPVQGLQGLLDNWPGNDKNKTGKGWQHKKGDT
ncbi:hypothetical protein Gura_2943 [Geotalea uraniireducens Rf4]|uniref:Uncharacterized protein n=1 Tax=Geotalea uraniireducens (strain Rf4) TaxID=351605 RepID=A5G5P7_GEOUR|nr:hypothetical protein Gura_2943 [Geotalea uraniireducens Rf4]